MSNRTLYVDGDYYYRVRCTHAANSDVSSPLPVEFTSTNNPKKAQKDKNIRLKKEEQNKKITNQKMKRLK